MEYCYDPFTGYKYYYYFYSSTLYWSHYIWSVIISDVYSSHVNRQSEHFYPCAPSDPTYMVPTAKDILFSRTFTGKIIIFQDKVYKI